MTFEEKIIRASILMQEGQPLKDLLDDQEIQQAILVLSDVYVATGVKVPET